MASSRLNDDAADAEHSAIHEGAYVKPITRDPIGCVIVQGVTVWPNQGGMAE